MPIFFLFMNKVQTDKNDLVLHSLLFGGGI